MRLTEKLLSLLHRVFDKDPGKFLAFRLQYDGGMTWRIADATLYTTVAGGSGGNLQVDLTKYTLGELYNYLASRPGYSLPFGDYSELSLLSSRVLLDGTGNIAASNGDHFYGYTSVLWSYMEAQANELAQAEVQIGEMLKQLTTKTAQREWLDEIGSYYGVPRLQGETDSSYGPRIIAEVLRPRGNNVAMEMAIQVFTGQIAKVTDVTVYGDVFPLYNGAITRNSDWFYNATNRPLYGLFDVEYGYDFEGGPDITEFSQIVRDLIGRLRDAGTHLRSLLLRGSDMSDTVPAAPTDGGAVQWTVSGDFSDSVPAPDDAALTLSISMLAFSETIDAPDDDLQLAIVYDYRYNSVRHYNSAITRVGGLTIVESV